MTVVDELVAFVHARLDEDEQRADKWHRNDCAWMTWGSGEVPCDCGGKGWVLRDVEGTRRLVDDLIAQRHIMADEYYGCGAIEQSLVHDDGLEHPTGRECTCGRDEDVARRLRLLAAVYSDHPDFREEWRP